MLITVDHREKAPPLLAEFRKKGLPVRRALLPLGDYLIDGELLFERKTIPDLLVSLTDGRLFRQARRLYHWRARYPGSRAAFIIEGRIRPPGIRQWERRLIQGALLKITLQWGIPLLRSLEPAESARIMLYAARQHSRGRLRTPLPALTFPEQTLASGHSEKRLVQQQLLQILPGIGPRRARALLEQFGSITAIVNADERELAATENLGREMARRIRWLVSEAPRGYRADWV